MVSSSCSTTSTVLPQVAKIFERGKQAAIVAMMQPDRGLVQHVELRRAALTQSASPAECAGLRRPIKVAAERWSEM